MGKEKESEYAVYKIPKELEGEMSMTEAEAILNSSSIKHIACCNSSC